MPFTKLHNVDGFVYVDLDGAERVSGVVRSARKVLRDSAAGLARHRTYAYAAMAVEASGASAGINAEPDDRDAALASFVEEVAPLGVMFDPGKGVTAAHLAALSSTDTRDPVTLGFATRLEAVGIVAAIAAVRPLDGLRVGIESGEHGDLDELLAAGGATARHVEPGRIDEPCDVLVVGSRPGVIDHENATSVAAAVVVPAAPLPVSTRGLATLRRQGITLLPDFVTLGGALLTHWPERGAVDADAAHSLVTERVTEVIAEVIDHPDGPVIGAAERAEAFLATWRDELPFGRPI